MAWRTAWLARSLALHRAISRIRPSSSLLAVFSSPRSFHPRYITRHHSGHAHRNAREEHATGWSAVRIGPPRMFIAVFRLCRAAPRSKRGARAPRGEWSSRQFVSSHGTRLFQPRSESSPLGKFRSRSETFDPNGDGYWRTMIIFQMFSSIRTGGRGHGIRGKAIDRPACPSLAWRQYRKLSRRIGR